jgi:hypothetical protein
MQDDQGSEAGVISLGLKVSANKKSPGLAGDF